MSVHVPNTLPQEEQKQVPHTCRRQLSAPAAQLMAHFCSSAAPSALPCQKAQQEGQNGSTSWHQSHRKL